ncbi:GGDEF domain-containing protein [Lysinibacillus endophyticus]|uniref:GGDEF domain-containing protein n=1 Tax=Ureibacillus endophyticus TaxID=1978490 RepID=UPI00209F9EAC|nr:GGDEF domain-containing protein [Lysinibacillus endophyticus]MCP1144496.1 GGDEF domain-containing protein [Lysinibacillus endophyticus]
MDDREQLLIKSEIIKQNLHKISLLNRVFTIVIVFLFLFTNIITNIPILNLDNLINISYFNFFSLFTFNFLIFLIVDIRKIQINNDNIKKVELFITLYVTFFLSIGAFISMREQEIYNPLLIYTMILFTCSSFLVLSVKQVSIPLITSTCVLLLGLYLQHGFDQIFILQLLYIASIIPIAFFISQSFYYSFKRSIKFQIEMVREAQISRELTKKLREANRKLELQSMLDPLTSLFNRRAYNNYLKELQTKILENSYDLSVIMIDVDCFKMYNDTYGHAEGDKVLLKIAQVLKDLADEYHCFATRWGGEEFALLLFDVPEAFVKEMCNEVKTRVNQLQINHNTSHISDVVSVSIGASTKTILQPDDILACIKQADEALYFVKEHGRNNFEHVI